ncbi:MAG: hypothetical protein V2A66_04350, partial [Pseudomonadota bacterium]
PPWLVVDEVLSEYGRRRREALQRFDAFVRAGVPAEVERRYSMSKLPSVLGSEGFRDWIKYNFVTRLRSNEEIPAARAACRRIVSLPSILRFVSFVYGVRTKELLGRMMPAKNEARSVAIWLMRRAAGAGHNEIAKAMGDMEKAAVAKALQRFEVAMRSDPSLDKKAERFAEQVLSNVQT